MHLFGNPKWISKELLALKSIEEIPGDFLKQLGEDINNMVSDTPEVSICLVAWNEELNIIRCLDSLRNSKSKVPFEIVIVNNNSKDSTGEIIEKIGIQSYFQPIQGCGVSRELAQQKARGKYVICADADCLYHPEYIDKMYQALSKPGVVAAYSKHSFLSDGNGARLKYFLYDIIKDLLLEIRHFKRPYLNAYGMCFAYIREYGIKEGFALRNMGGSDGRMCFDLMKYGKVQAERSSKSRVWTSARNLQRDGSFGSAVKKRVKTELGRFMAYSRETVPHDTKRSSNRDLF